MNTLLMLVGLIKSLGIRLNSLHRFWLEFASSQLIVPVMELGEIGFKKTRSI
jgi:hypothetical protein